MSSKLRVSSLESAYPHILLALPTLIDIEQGRLIYCSLLQGLLQDIPMVLEYAKSLNVCDQLMASYLFELKRKSAYHCSALNSRIRKKSFFFSHRYFLERIFSFASPPPDLLLLRQMALWNTEMQEHWESAVYAMYRRTVLSAVTQAKLFLSKKKLVQAGKIACEWFAFITSKKIATAICYQSYISQSLHLLKESNVIIASKYRILLNHALSKFISLNLILAYLDAAKGMFQLISTVDETILLHIYVYLAISHRLLMQLVDDRCWQRRQYQCFYSFTAQNNFICPMSRFQQSNTNFYSTISYSRPATSDVKFSRNRMASTGEGFLPNNTNTNFRPQTANGMFRSSSSSFRNTKGKLEMLADQLSTLLEDTKQTRTTNKEMQLHLEFLKEDLNQQGIDPLRHQLTQSIKMLDKTLQIKQRSDCLKFQTLNETCIALNRNTKQLRSKMSNLNERLFQIENLLGYHGLRDKLKY